MWLPIAMHIPAPAPVLVFDPSVTSDFSTPYIELNEVLLTCSVTGSGASPSIQWTKNGSPVSGATGSQLSLSTTAESGDYSCTSGDLTSGTETVTIVGKLLLVPKGKIMFYL